MSKPLAGIEENVGREQGCRYDCDNEWYFVAFSVRTRLPDGGLTIVPHALTEWRAYTQNDTREKVLKAGDAE